MTKILATLFAAFFTLEASAQPQQATPNPSQLQRERDRVERERKAVFDPANPATKLTPGQMPNDASVAREMKKIEKDRKAIFDESNKALKNAPNSFPNIATPERSNIDLEALAKRYERKAEGRRSDNLMIFASFTMPKESLKRLIQDANKAGGMVVLRGFKDGSLKNTAIAVNALGEASGNVAINPNAFTKYRIKAVPAVVLLKPEGQDLVDNEGCALPDKYVMVAGDVTLRFALDHIAQQSRDFSDMAARYARPLKEGKL